jgi:hypothetical protein
VIFEPLKSRISKFRSHRRGRQGGRSQATGHHLPRSWIARCQHNLANSRRFISQSPKSNPVRLSLVNMESKRQPLNTVCHQTLQPPLPTALSNPSSLSYNHTPYHARLGVQHPRPTWYYFPSSGSFQELCSTLYNILTTNTKYTLKKET